jgi:hypothetical protein
MVAHALGAHVVAAQAEVREAGGGAQRDREDRGAVRADVAVAGEAEAVQLAEQEHGAQVVHARGREEAEAGDAGAGGDDGELVEDVRPLGGPRAGVLEPEVRAHADGGGQVRAQGSMRVWSALDAQRSSCVLAPPQFLPQTSAGTVARRSARVSGWSISQLKDDSWELQHKCCGRCCKLLWI